MSSRFLTGSFFADFRACATRPRPAGREDVTLLRSKRRQDEVEVVEAGRCTLSRLVVGIGARVLLLALERARVGLLVKTPEALPVGAAGRSAARGRFSFTCFGMAGNVTAETGAARTVLEAGGIHIILLSCSDGGGSHLLEPEQVPTNLIRYKKS